jgi:hypothetical protein
LRVPEVVDDPGRVSLPIDAFCLWRFHPLDRVELQAALLHRPAVEGLDAASRCRRVAGAASPQCSFRKSRRPLLSGPRACDLRPDSTWRLMVQPRREARALGSYVTYINHSSESESGGAIRRPDRSRISSRQGRGERRRTQVGPAGVGFCPPCACPLSRRSPRR